MEENIERFIEAQEHSYECALEEIRRGRKESHWMWYIFPQVTGLGMSPISEYFAIKSLEEAKVYLNHEVLGSRLREISNVLLTLETSNPTIIFGPIDALKLRSSMTLFAYVSNDEIFTKVLDKYYDGEKDERTIAICDELRFVKLAKK